MRGYEYPVCDQMLALVTFGNRTGLVSRSGINFCPSKAGTNYI